MPLDTRRVKTRLHFLLTSSKKLYSPYLDLRRQSRIEYFPTELTNLTAISSPTNPYNYLLPFIANWTPIKEVHERQSF